MGMLGRRVKLPTQPVVLTAEQICELNEKLSKTRHDVNNHLAVMVAAIELIRFKPESLERWLSSIDGHPMLVSDALKSFSADFEKLLQITPAAAEEAENPSSQSAR